MDTSRVRLLKDGDSSCFEEVFYAVNKKLYNYFAKRIASGVMCEDLVQETFVRLWKYRHSLDESLELDIQIFRIAKTLVIDVLRKGEASIVVTLPIENLPEPALVPENELLQEKREALQSLISTLPPVRRKILDLRLDGYSNKEIAARLTISVKTVENSINTAFHELRKKPYIPFCILVLLMY